MRVRSWTQEQKDAKSKRKSPFYEVFLIVLPNIQMYKYNVFRFIYMFRFFFASARPVFVWQYRCFLWQCTKAWARTCSSQRRFITTENNTTFKSPLNCVTPGNFFIFLLVVFFFLLLVAVVVGRLRKSVYKYLY